MKLKIIVAIYVDDFLIFYKNIDDLNKIKFLLNQSFKMKDLGPAKCCLGIRITQGDGYIELDQEQYISEVLKTFEMHDCKPAGTPVDVSQKLSKEGITKDNSFVGKVPYQEAVGSLLYI